MKVFISYSHQDVDLAESIAIRLRESHHNVFFDRSDIPSSKSFDTIIRKQIAHTDFLIFIASRESLSQGAYALTELALFKKRVQTPDGRLLTICVRGQKLSELPPYLRSVSIPDIEGDLPAEVTARTLDCLNRLRLRYYRQLLPWVVSFFLSLAIAMWLSHSPLIQQFLDVSNFSNPQDKKIHTGIKIHPETLGKEYNHLPQDNFNAISHRQEIIRELAELIESDQSVEALQLFLRRNKQIFLPRSYENSRRFHPKPVILEDFRINGFRADLAKFLPVGSLSNLPGRAVFYVFLSPLDKLESEEYRSKLESLKGLISISKSDWSLLRNELETREDYRTEISWFHISAVLYIGRRKNISKSELKLLQNLNSTRDLQVLTYDSLIETLIEQQSL